MPSSSERFKNEQIARLAGAGWSRCPSVAAAVAAAGLPGRGIGSARCAPALAIL